MQQFHVRLQRQQPISLVSYTYLQDSKGCQVASTICKRRADPAIVNATLRCFVLCLGSQRTTAARVHGTAQACSGQAARRRLSESTPTDASHDLQSISSTISSSRTMFPCRVMNYMNVSAVTICSSGSCDAVASLLQHD